MKVRFFKNNTTGTVRFTTVEEAVAGEDEIELLANTTDAATEKHVPVVSVNGKDVHVEVGSVLHPMTAEHHISFITVVTDERVEQKALPVEGAPVADFVLADGETLVAVYEYCNLHGLWVKNI